VPESFAVPAPALRGGGDALPAGLPAALARAYAELERRAGCPGVPVAVRSSAVGEDAPGRSFAGQLRSVVGVSGAPAVAAAVLACRSAADSEAVRRYAGAAPAMAVGVSVVREPYASGVAFSRDPVSGAPVTVIEAVWGFGTALQDGAVVPDQLVVDGGEILDPRPGLKPVRATLAAPAGEPVPASRQRAPVLDAAAALEIAALTARAAEALGRPADVEWTMPQSGRRVLIVQARPAG
jgi:pyruvate,water dikinase